MTNFDLVEAIQWLVQTGTYQPETPQERERKHIEQMAATIAAGFVGCNPGVNPGWVDLETTVAAAGLEQAMAIVRLNRENPNNDQS